MSFCSLSLTHFIQRKSFLVLLFPPFTFFIFIFLHEEMEMMMREQKWGKIETTFTLRNTMSNIFLFSLSPLSSSLSFYYLYNIYFMLIVLITVGTSSRVESSFHSSSRLFSLFFTVWKFFAHYFQQYEQQEWMRKLFCTPWCEIITILFAIICFHPLLPSFF